MISFTSYFSFVKYGSYTSEYTPRLIDEKKVYMWVSYATSASGLNFLAWTLKLLELANLLYIPYVYVARVIGVREQLWKTLKVQRELKHLLREWLGTKRDRCYELIAHDLCLFYLIILLRLVNCVGAFRGCGIDLCVLVCVWFILW